MTYTFPQICRLFACMFLMLLFNGTMPPVASSQPVLPACANVQCGSDRVPLQAGNMCMCIPRVILERITAGGSGINIPPDELKCAVPCPSGFTQGPTCDCRPSPVAGGTSSSLLKLRLKGLRKQLGLQGTSGGLEYTCESGKNQCSCNNSDPLDCIDLIADGECSGHLEGPDGKPCIGQSGTCTCKWH